MKKTFNELHHWLLENWTDALKLQDSMAAVSKEYDTVFERVNEAVGEEQPGLNHFLSKLGSTGQVAFARKEWPSRYPAWPTGFWLGGIGLDNLMADEGETPSAAIWLAVPKSAAFSLELARTKIQISAGELMKGETLTYLFKDGKNLETCFWFNLPESRETLRKMLLDDDLEKFVESLKSNVMILSRFIPVLDEVLLKNSP